MKQKKKVLIITYYWPPSGGAGVQRWLKFAKYLPDYGWQPVIYTPKNPEAPANDESLSKDIDPTTEVIKKIIWEPYSWYKKFTGKKKTQKINAGFLQEKKSNPVLENLSVFIRGNFFIPDARKFWIRPSVKFLVKYLKNNKIDIVVSTGPPHSMHLIAMKLKQVLNIKWVADFRDPWTNIDFYKDLKLTKRGDKKHKKLEKEVLSKADCVITIGETLGKEFMNLSAKKVEVISNGFDPEDIPVSRPSLDKKFSIVHVGSLNRDRNHSVFWKVLQELVKDNIEFASNLEIKLIGKVDFNIFNQINNYGLSSKLKHLEYIDHDMVIIELMKARLLYLPINDTPNAKGIVTGKLYEYLASKRPILTIGLIRSDISETLDQTKAGKIFDFNDFGGVKRYINDRFMNYINQKDDISKIKINNFSRKKLTEKLSELLDTVCNE